MNNMGLELINDGWQMICCEGLIGFTLPFILVGDSNNPRTVKFLPFLSNQYFRGWIPIAIPYEKSCLAVQNLLYHPKISP